MREGDRRCEPQLPSFGHVHWPVPADMADAGNLISGRTDSKRRRRIYNTLYPMPRRYGNVNADAQRG